MKLEQIRDLLQELQSMAVSYVLAKHRSDKLGANEWISFELAWRRVAEQLEGVAREWGVAMSVRPDDATMRAVASLRADRSHQGTLRNLADLIAACRTWG